MNPTKFDLIIYRLFYWKWNNILASNPGIRDLFRQYLDYYESDQK